MTTFCTEPLREIFSINSSEFMQSYPISRELYSSADPEEFVALKYSKIWYAYVPKYFLNIFL